MCVQLPQFILNNLNLSLFTAIYFDLSEIASIYLDLSQNMLDKGRGGAMVNLTQIAGLGFHVFRKELISPILIFLDHYQCRSTLGMLS